jgi:ferredoxin
MAYHHELIERYGRRVSVFAQDEVGILDLDAILGDLPPGCLVYCCGPEGLIAAVEKRSSEWQAEALQVERFAPKSFEERGADTAFEVELTRTGKVVQIPPSQSVLQALEAAGVELETSCSIGTCGTCETSVLAGFVDHRDSILSRAERDKHDTMMPCVSRAKSKRLVLDL